MDPSAFKDDKTGKIVQTVHGHPAFVPASPPSNLTLDGPTELALSRADAALGELSGLGRYLPNPDLLIAQYMKREAVASSRIDGTHADLSDLLMDELATERTNPASDVQESPPRAPVESDS